MKWTREVILPYIWLHRQIASYHFGVNLSESSIRCLFTSQNDHFDEMNIEERAFTVVWGILSFSYHKLKLPIHYLKLILPFIDTDKANLIFIMSEWLFSTL